MHFETLVMIQDWLKDDKIDNQKVLSALIKFYKTDKRYRNFSFADTIFYLLALEDGRYLAQYIALLEKELGNDSNEILMAKKFMYAYYLNHKMAPLNKAYNNDFIRECKYKFKNTHIENYIPRELKYEVESKKSYTPIIPGFEDKWIKKAIKYRKKAVKLLDKYKTYAALQLLEENVDKYGDGLSAEVLGNYYEKKEDHKNAYKYHFLAKECGIEHSYKYFISKHRMHEYVENVNLAFYNRGKKDELKYLLEAYKYEKMHKDEIRMLNIYSQKKLDDYEKNLSKKLIFECLNRLTDNQLDNEYVEFINIYTLFVSKIEIFKNSNKLAVIAALSLDMKETNLVKLIYDEKEKVLKTIKEKVSKDICAMEEQIIKQTEISEMRKPQDLMSHNQEYSTNKKDPLTKSFDDFYFDYDDFEF